MTTAETVLELISCGDADRPAILAPGRAPLTFAALKNLVEKTIASLNGFGVGRGDRVAIVLPNGAGNGGRFPRCRGGGRRGAAQSRLIAPRNSNSILPTSEPRR